jgi:hypothetical protein
MTADPNKKSQRTFQCKDQLWQKFEQMAKELECSVDYLVNDAMKQYARQRGYGASASPSIPPPLAAPPPPSSAPAPSSSALPLPPPVAAPPKAPPPPAPGKRPAPPMPSAGPPLPPPSMSGGPRRAPTPPPLNATARSMPPAPPPPGARPVPPPIASPGMRLTISYQGESFPVTKDRFIIGRGKQSSDLTIKDPNVSRQHAMIEFTNGQYYIVDMGSTNGVEYNGQRVQRKVISEGDSFRVCDHELKFSFG